MVGVNPFRSSSKDHAGLTSQYMLPVQIRLTRAQVDFIETLVEKGIFNSRSMYIRMLVGVDMARLKEKL